MAVAFVIAAVALVSAAGGAGDASTTPAAVAETPPSAAPRREPQSSRLSVPVSMFNDAPVPKANDHHPKNSSAATSGTTRSSVAVGGDADLWVHHISPSARAKALLPSPQDAANISVDPAACGRLRFAAPLIGGDVFRHADALPATTSASSGCMWDLSPLQEAMDATAKRRQVSAAFVEVGCNFLPEMRGMHEQHRLRVGVEPIHDAVNQMAVDKHMDFIIQAAAGLPPRRQVGMAGGTSVLNKLVADTAARESTSPLIALDDVLRAIPEAMPIDFLMIDAQGHDLEVALSASRQQLKRVSNLAIECQHLDQGDFRWLYPGAPNCSAMSSVIVQLGFTFRGCYYNKGPNEYNCHFTPTNAAASAFQLSRYDLMLMLCPTSGGTRACVDSFTDFKRTKHLGVGVSERKMPLPGRHHLFRCQEDKFQCWNRVRKGVANPPAIDPYITLEQMYPKECGDVERACQVIYHVTLFKHKARQVFKWATEGDYKSIADRVIAEKRRYIIK